MAGVRRSVLPIPINTAWFQHFSMHCFIFILIFREILNFMRMLYFVKPSQSARRRTAPTIFLAIKRTACNNLKRTKFQGDLLTLLVSGSPLAVTSLTCRHSSFSADRVPLHFSPRPVQHRTDIIDPVVLAQLMMLVWLFLVKSNDNRPLSSADPIIIHCKQFLIIQAYSQTRYWLGTSCA